MKLGEVQLSVVEMKSNYEKADFMRLFPHESILMRKTDVVAHGSSELKDLCYRLSNYAGLINCGRLSSFSPQGSFFAFSYTEKIDDTCCVVKAVGKFVGYSDGVRSFEAWSFCPHGHWGCHYLKHFKVEVPDCFVLRRCCECEVCWSERK